MNQRKPMTRLCSLILALVMVFGTLPVSSFAAEADATLTASLAEAKSYIDGITINNASNDPATVVKTFKTHFTWDNEKRENSKSYLFDWSYYNGVVFEGLEYVYEVSGEQVYADYVIEYMSSLITASGGWATCTNNSSKQCAGYNSTHGADCYKTASLLMDSYEMTGDSRYLTMAATLYADLDTAAKSYSLSNAGNNFRHTWASDPSPDLWLDGLYMILPFRAEYAKYIGDTEELDLIVDRMQWVSDNMYNSSKGLFYHAADSASSNSGTYWLRSIGWYAAAIVDIMDSMEGENLEAMKQQLVKLVDGMKVCQNSSNGMWLNNMNASQSSSNPYETSGTALTCYAVMKAVNRGWLDESYADMAILAFNGICNEKLSGSTLTDICFKGAPGSSNSTFYDNEGKGVGPFIMFYAEMLRYVNTEDQVPEETVPEETEPEETEPEATEPEETIPEETQPEEPAVPVYQGTGNLAADTIYTLDSDGIDSGEKYLIVYSAKALENNNGVDNNPAVTISSNTITLSDDSTLAWTITQSGSDYYVENNGSYLNLTASGTDPIGSSATVYISRSGSTYKFRNTSSSGAYLRYSNSQLFCAGTNSSNNGMSLYRRTGSGLGDEVVFTVSPSATTVNPGETLALNGTVTVGGESAALSSCAITWASTNDAVATVSGGTVTGISGGNASITATLTAVGGTDLHTPIVLTVPVTVQAHVYEAVVTAPTCTEGGYTTYTCDCGDSYVADHTAALGHDYESVVTEPTCTAQGFTTLTCARCADSYVDGYTAALGHDYESATVEATCTADGSVTYTCACGDSYAEVIPATGHDYTSLVTAPTCTEGGYTTHTCGNCGDSYVTDETTALGHTYKSVTVEATCTADGSVTYTCACGDSYAEVIPATGHDYTSLVTAPTCTEGGYTTHTCGNCGDSYVTDETAALGHTYKTAILDATCTADGSIVHTCTACGDNYTEVIPATGHNYTSVVTAPTCTEEGFTTYTCTACGDSYASDYTAALGHDYESVTVEATCTADGSVSYTCTCGDAYTEVIPAKGHDYTAVVTVPTCTEGGYTTYTCSVCGDSYISDEVAALGHSYEAVTVEATCTTDGSVTYTCTCGDTYTEVIPATGHSYTSLVTAPTCTENGYTTHTCGNCGDSYISDETAALGHDYETITVAPTCTEAGYTSDRCTVCGVGSIHDETPALGHSYTSVTTEATCTAGGYTTHTCGVCGDVYTDAHVEALGHRYASVITAPTCETAGFTTHTCSVCGDSYISDEVAALGHSYESVTVDATCTTDGSVTYTCACGDSYTEVIPATGHDYSSVVTEPNCTEGGYTTHTCGNCGDSYVSDETAALGHDYEAITVDATCTADGSVTYTCVCGDSYMEVIPATGHDYSSVVTEPTCTEGGYTTHTCGNCGDSYISDETAALGHSYESVTVDAACTTDGSVTYTCVCGDSYTVVIPATGHDYSSVVTAPTCTEGGYATHTCSNCGDSYVSDETAALGHSYESVTVDATCTTDGSVTYTCVCGDSYTEVIPATGHSYTCVESDGSLVYTCGSCGDSYTEIINWIALSGIYVLDTDGVDIGEDHKYILVGTDHDYALTLNGTTIGAAAVTVEDDTITLSDGSAYEFWFADNGSAESGSYLLTQDGSKYVYHMGGNMYYGTDNKGYWHIGSGSDGAYQLYDYDNLNWYLNYGYVWGSDSVSRFAVSSTARAVRLFQAAEGYVRLAGAMNQTCTDADGMTVETILEKLAIQTSTDGSIVSGSLAVTADLVTWDTAFDGTTAGTYTATVSYQGQVLGTVTVTVTGKHAYETVVVAPTCTEGGYTVRTCGECGARYESHHTDALGHSYTCVESDGYLVYTCDRCGDSYSEKAISYTQVSSFTSGSSYIITLYSGGQYYALSHAGNYVSAVQVTVSDGEITSEITEDLLWNYSGSKLSYVSGGATYYMYSYTNNWWGGWWGNNGTTLTLSTSNSSTVSFSNNRLRVGSYYLRYSNGSISLNSSSTTTYLFVEG